MIWESDGVAYYAAVADMDGKPLYYLVVERLPGDGWSWIVWPSRKPRQDRAKSGAEWTVQEAMRAAEDAAAGR